MDYPEFFGFEIFLDGKWKGDRQERRFLLFPPDFYAVKSLFKTPVYELF